MSRKKITLDKKFFERLNLLIQELNISQTELANTVGISQGYLSMILQGKRGASVELITGLYNNYSDYFHWVLTGEGGMLRKELDDTYIYKDALDEDPEVAMLLEKTREIVKSGTEYAVSLKANIGSFHNAMLLERRVQDHEQRLALVEKTKSGGCAAGVPDPAAEKNDPGKREAM